MARFLFVTQPITGHVLPALPLVRALCSRGHEVLWYVGQKFRRQVEATGARFAPYREAYDFDDADYNRAFPGRDQLRGLDQIRFDFTHVFIRQIAAQHRDLAAILRHFPADVTVGDPSVVATFTLNEQGGPPNATYNITCLGLKGRDVAPFGLGILPDGSFTGRLRNRLLALMADRVIFRSVSSEMIRQCDLIGARRRRFEGVSPSPYLFLEPTVPSFEYPRRDLPPQVHFIGALLPDPPEDFTPPPFWGEVISQQRRVVLVTQGTVATDARELVAPTLSGLAGEDVLVIAAGVKDARQFGLDVIPGNARVAPFVPFKPLLPHVDAYVTNGGFGGVHYALANGVPIIAAGATEDKPEIGNRVAYSGVGINLKTSAPTPAQVRAAVRAVLDEPRYRSAARRLQEELAAHDAPVEGARLLEQLAEARRPVLRAAEALPAPQPLVPPRPLRRQRQAAAGPA